MTLMDARERSIAQAVSELTYCNPFLPERITHEREALGDEFSNAKPDWNIDARAVDDHPNVVNLTRRVESLATTLRDRLREGARPSKTEADLYVDLVIFMLYQRRRADFAAFASAAPTAAGKPARADFFDAHEHEAAEYLLIRDRPMIARAELPHLFACFFQIKRAFFHIFKNIIGVSKPVVRFRAAVWQSIFTHDMRRYRRVLYDRMADFTTLVTGPSGTGKELAARAVGLSRFVPFDPKSRTFAADPAKSFHAVNLSALSPALIESELFGHKKGAFTGALADRAGWLAVCPPLGTVFLDEIGDLDASIQVKLLRVLQSRTFQRVGDTADLHFGGKIIAATNRTPAEECAAGRLREDFYYRLCSDLIEAPSLYERLLDAPQELDHLVRFIADRLVGAEAETLTAEVVEYVRNNLGRDYPWHGNVRELEQCVRNIMIRKHYQPAQPRTVDARRRFAEQVCSGSLTADELLSKYCTLVYAGCGNYSAAAARLGLDRRTVKSRIDRLMLDQLAGVANKSGPI